MPVKTPITIAYGDGIGPEIMAATLKILTAAKADIEPEVIEIGQKVYLEGFTSGIPDAAWESLIRTKVLLKGPITTPQGGGYKSLNVTLRKTLGLYANVRPNVAYAPFVHTNHPKMDLVIIRENEEGTYAGIEHRQTDEVYQCLKIVTRPGCERIVHYAFEYARKFNRKKVTCLTKDNIMKMTDGIFHQVFNEIATQYPDIQNEHLIIDIGTALVAAEPERFDVIVTSNLYGDILSDVAAQIAGSVGLAGSANVGNQMAMFEAIHGSAPDIAGKKMANPSGLLNAAIQMLIHINQPKVAALIENAWLTTLEDGLHTGDIYSKEHSKKKVNTDEFADAVIERLGRNPTHFKTVEYKETKTNIECLGESKKPMAKKELVGIDIFVDNPNMTPEQLGEKVATITGPLKLIVITSRGLKIWPNCMIQAPFAQHCSCRFQTSVDTKNLSTVTHMDLIHLLQQFELLGLDVIKTENLYTFDGKIGYSLAQGQ
ncbi:MAG: NADP-dependent isocitrate dehydrogenase [Gammaproteobacteria bacterium]|nr:NADP-dependent isocitrate dehydrogenase [Gammaproteobacteria bacterium]